MLKYSDLHKKKSPDICRGFCDPAGARTQDPYIKSVLLYQLSYGIGNYRMYALPRAWLVILSGLEPETYCLEGSCSIQLSYRTF